MYHPWRSLGYYGLTKELNGEYRSLRRGSVQYIGMLVGEQPQHVVVTIDGIKYDDRFEDTEPSNEGIVYTTCTEPLAHIKSLVSSAIFSYLNREDFDVNPYEFEIRRIEEDFYREEPTALDDLPQRLAVAFDRRKRWNV